MAKQAVELEEPETPLIASGNTDIDAEKSVLATRATGDGVVEMVNGKMGVRYEGGKFVAFPEAISGMNHVVISHSTPLKVGDKVTSGQKLTSATIASHGYQIGKNANVFYINYLGKT